LQRPHAEELVATIRYAQKAVKSLVDERQQEQPSRKGTVKPRPEGVLNKEDGERQHGNPKDRIKLAENRLGRPRSVTPKRPKIT
jgi:hypothetical protein